MREKKELEHLQATATILAKAGIQENVYLFGSSRGFSGGESQGFGVSGRQTGTLLGSLDSGHFGRKTGTLLGSQGLGVSGRQTGVLSSSGRNLSSGGTVFRSSQVDLPVTNRATQALQGTRRTVALESGFTPQDFFTPGIARAPADELLGVTSHPLGFKETRRVQGFGGSGSGLRLMTAREGGPAERPRLLRTESARAFGGSGRIHTVAGGLGRFTGGLSAAGLLETAASLGSTSFRALAQTISSERIFGSGENEFGVGGTAYVGSGGNSFGGSRRRSSRRVSWASGDDGRPEAFSQNGKERNGTDERKLMRTQTRRRGFERGPETRPVQRELFRPEGSAERNEFSERNGWSEDEEPRVWEHNSSVRKPGTRGDFERASVMKDNGTDFGRPATRRFDSVNSRKKAQEDALPADSFSGSELVPAEGDIRGNSRSARKIPRQKDWVYQPASIETVKNRRDVRSDGFESRFQSLEEASQKAFSAAAAATSGAETWVQGLVPERHGTKSKGRRRSEEHRKGAAYLEPKTSNSVEESNAEFDAEGLYEIPQTTAERRRFELEELGGVRLLRRTTRVLNPTGAFGAMNERRSDPQDGGESGALNLSADVRALRDAILMQAASSRQAYEELCDVIAGFAGAGRIFGGDDLRALGTVVGGRGLGVSRAPARGFEKGRVEKMMRKLMAKLGDAPLDERGFKEGLQRSGSGVEREGSTRGFEEETPVKLERKKTAPEAVPGALIREGSASRSDKRSEIMRVSAERGQQDAKEGTEFDAAAQHARHVAAARIQVRCQRFVVSVRAGLHLSRACNSQEERRS
jgi:hypothetical protein